MASYISVSGSLLPVMCPSRQSVDSTRPVSFTRTMGGKVKGFEGPAARRVWALQAGVASDSERSSLAAIAAQRGVVGWYPDEAVAGNLLSPQASMFEPGTFNPAVVTPAGLVALPDGTVAQSIVPSGDVTPGNGGEHTPVPPSGRIAVGVWGDNGARLTGWWRDSGGATVANFDSGQKSGSGWVWHQHHMAVPTWAAYLTLTLSGGARFALPSISWGTTAYPVVGAGVPKAKLHSASYDLLAVRQGGSLTDLSYTITEVG